MLTAHGLWLGESELALWAEDLSDDATAAPTTGPSEPHPFAADGCVLSAALAEALGPGVDDVRQLTLSLPARGGRPRPVAAWTRPDARRPPPEADERFVVPAVVVGAPGWVKGLRRLAEVGRGPLRRGPSVDLLAALAEAVIVAVADGAVVPSLAADADGRGRARWVWTDERAKARVTEDLADRGGASWRLLGDAARPGPRSRRGPAATLDEIAGDMLDGLCRSLFVPEELDLEGSSPDRRADGLGDWVRALGPAGPVVPPPGRDGEPEEVAALAQRVERWSAPARAVPEWRLCFRLCEPGAPSPPPEADAGPWRVALFLQAVGDPSLVVSAAEVWAAGPSIQRAARARSAPGPFLLAELGRAVRTASELAGALDAPAPAGFDLDVDGAHEFMTSTAARLVDGGFGVWLPTWWRAAPAMSLRLRTRAVAQAGRAAAGLDVAALCAYDWKVALGGHSISEAELQTVARLKAPLVRWRGQWVEHDPALVERVVQFLADERAAPERTMTAKEAVATAVGARQVLAGVPIEDVEPHRELAPLFAGTMGDHLGPTPTPPGFVGVLRPYQQRGLSWLHTMERLGLGACLADDMGLGKTATVLALEVMERAAPDLARREPTLIVCPTSLVGNWCCEAARFAPSLRVATHHGDQRARQATPDAFASADLVVTSYTVATRDQVLLAGIGWRRLVLDEAHHIKNPAAQQTQAVRGLRARHRIALSGTPIENHLGDLWSIMDIVNPGLLGSAESFRRRFAGSPDDEEVAARQLRRVIGPLVLRRLKTDRRVLADLPDKIETTERCTLTREQATLYQAVVHEMLGRLDGVDPITRRGRVLTALLRLKQICNHPAQYLADGSRLSGRSGKLERTVEHLAHVLELGERALVFTQFSEMGALLRGHLEARLGARVGFLHGGLRRTERDALVEHLDAGALDVLVLSLRAGGTGLNLTAANHVVHFDRWWNPAVEDQATDRAYRIGQSRDVQVRTLVCAGTVEDRIDAIMRRKARLSSLAIGGELGSLTELATDRLTALVALSPDPGDG